MQAAGPRAGRALWALAAALAVACGGALPRVDPDRLAARVGDPRLNEASGLAASSAEDELLWALDDSGNPPVLHAFGADGRPRGLLEIEDASDLDWEALDAFEWEGRPWLLVADVGDNAEARPEVLLHVVPEPQPAELAPDRRIAARPAWTVSVRLENGPADCEAVAVDPTEERIYFVTKRSRPVLLLSAPLRPEGGAPAVARVEAAVAIPEHEVGALTLPLPTWRYRGNVTGLAFSPDGRSAAVLTYGEVYLFTRRPEEAWAAALSRPPEELGAPGLWQAEAITFSRDGRAVWVTGEERNPRLVRFEIPSDVRTATDREASTGRAGSTRPASLP